jgi:hypothetical protein
MPSAEAPSSPQWSLFYLLTWHVVSLSQPCQKPQRALSLSPPVVRPVHAASQAFLHPSLSFLYLFAAALLWVLFLSYLSGLQLISLLLTFYLNPNQFYMLSLEMMMTVIK